MSWSDITDQLSRQSAAHAPLPTTVKIGLHDYRVLTQSPQETISTQRYGETSTNEKYIKLDVSYGTRKTGETLLHEILHAIFYEWALGDKDGEERTISVLSGGLGAVFRDNPDVARFLVEAFVDGRAPS